MTTYKAKHNIIYAAAAIISMLILVIALSSATAEAATLKYSTGKVSSSDGAILRTAASTKGKKVKLLNNKATVTIMKEVFTTKSRTAKQTRWYYVKCAGKKGYLRADLVGNITYAHASGRTTDGVNCRAGAGTKMPIKGTLNAGSSVTVQLKAKAKGSKNTWYRIKKDGKTYYIIAKYVKLTKTSSGSAKSEVAKALVANPTDGGTKCRVVYTFDETNCHKKFEVNGLDSAKTPQGVTFTGSIYTFVFGLDSSSGQAIVKYSKKGKRLDAVKVRSSLKMGHPNGIAYNPQIGKYYIFKGNQHFAYTYNPENDKFGTVDTPYSSSGIAYDRKLKLLVASSRTGMRVYSADNKFEQDQLILRCTHSGTHYVQDCGAYNGIIFHGVSGPNKARDNYIDVYRESDSSYLGSIKLTIGEIESLEVNSNGYLVMLINSPGQDWLWSTPLKVNEVI